VKAAQAGLGHAREHETDRFATLDLTPAADDAERRGARER
jgi:hypothetical protein